MCYICLREITRNESWIRDYEGSSHFRCRYFIVRLVARMGCRTIDAIRYVQQHPVLLQPPKKPKTK